MGKKSRKRRQKLRTPRLSVQAPAPAPPVPAPSGLPKAVEPGLPVDAKGMPEAPAAPRLPQVDADGKA